MDHNEITPILGDKKYQYHIENGGSLPIVETLEPNGWSEDHHAIITQISNAKNGDKFFRTVVGHPELETAYQCECQIAEYIDWFGREIVGVNIQKRKQITVDVIRETPLADANPDLWESDNKANKRVRDIHENLLADDTDEDTSSADSDASDPNDFEPTAVSQCHSASGYVSFAEEEKRDQRRNLLGK